MKTLFQTVALGATLFFNSLCFASVPSSINIDGISYLQVSIDPMGNHKISQYVAKGETLNDWTTYVAIHQFVGASDTTQFAYNQFGQDITVIPIDGDKNNIMVLVNTMNTVNDGDTVIYEQNAWHCQQFSLGKGIMAAQYSKRTVTANQANVSGIKEINPSVVEEIKALPLSSYQF